MGETLRKETKAQRAERLKLEKNPWAVFDEVRAFAREGRSSVVPEWASFYFKWWGVYTQGDGVGATGGKGGEGLATDWFMMRIGIPNGIVSASQLRTIGGLTRKYARNLADITVRQNIQLHWLSIESLPEVVDALDAIGRSLTDREWASHVIFSTGHHAGSHNREALPAREAGTRVVYMPGRDLALLAAEWLAEGLPPELPCALVSRAAQPGQQVVHTTLGALGATNPEIRPAAAPSLLIAGWAVRELASKSAGRQASGLAELAELAEFA